VALGQNYLCHGHSVFDSDTGAPLLPVRRAQVDVRQALELRMQAASAMWAARVKEVPAPQPQQVRPPAKPDSLSGFIFAF
jgi:hypothetical protein